MLVKNLGTVVPIFATERALVATMGSLQCLVSYLSSILFSSPFLEK